MIKTRLSPSMKKGLDSWEREIDKALRTGKGRYKETWPSDLFDHKKIIKLMRHGNIKGAWNWLLNLDSAGFDYIPDKIYNYLSNIMRERGY